MRRRTNIFGVVERKSPYRFIPYFSLFDYMTEGLPQDHSNGKQLITVLYKIGCHVIYAAAATIYLIGYIQTGKINPAEILRKFAIEDVRLERLEEKFDENFTTIKNSR